MQCTADKALTSTLTSKVPEEASPIISRALRVADVIIEESSSRGQLRFYYICVSATKTAQSVVDESETSVGPTRKSRFAVDVRIRLY